jgi:DNA-binding response OmpR family regulator
MKEVQGAQGQNEPRSATPAFLGKNILFIEDERGLSLTLSDRLTREGYRVTVASTGRAGYEKATLEQFDLILLDRMLPDMDGLEVCRRLRGQGSHIPVLVLTARGQLDDRVRGLKLGADDYLVKPFEPLELLARIEALLRRNSQGGKAQRPEPYRFGSIEVDFMQQHVQRDRHPIFLLPREYQLLCYFIKNRNEVLSRNRLLDEVWGCDSTPSSRTVDVHVACLRRKLELEPSNPRYFLTLHHRGYKFVG